MAVFFLSGRNCIDNVPSGKVVSGRKGCRRVTAIGFVTDAAGARLDTVLAGVAEVLSAEGWRLAGALGCAPVGAAATPEGMMLRLLPGGSQLSISQTLGAHSAGCRLDTQALEGAVGLAEAALDAAQGTRPALLIVNRFGKTEAAGRGFRPLIGRALVEGVPVLIAVSPANMGAFSSFTEGFAKPLPADTGQVLAWCRNQVAPARG